MMKLCEKNRRLHQHLIVQPLKNANTYMTNLTFTLDQHLELLPRPIESEDVTIPKANEVFRMQLAGR